MPPRAKKIKKCHPHPRGNRVCCVPLCDSTDDGTVNFHQFPRAGVKVAIKNTTSEEVFYCDTRKIWEDRVGDDTPITKKAMVCSRHFADEDYNTTSRWKASHRRLKPTAVPSLLLPDEYSDFYKYKSPKRLRQDFLNCLNNNNNDIIVKSSRVRKKYIRLSNKENNSAPDDVSPRNDTPLMHDNDISRSEKALPRDNDSPVSSDDILFIDEAQQSDDIPPNVFSPVNSVEGVEEQFYESDDDVVIVETKLDIKDDETKVKEDLMLEDRSESPKPLPKTETKEDVNAFLDLVLMHTSFEAEKLATSGVLVPYLDKCN